MSDQTASAPQPIDVEDAIAGRRYWLTLEDRPGGGPSYFGEILSYSIEAVTVRIEVASSVPRQETTVVETWPRHQTIIVPEP